jgi:hypothetical protein
MKALKCLETMLNPTRLAMIIKPLFSISDVSVTWWRRGLRRTGLISNTKRGAATCNESLCYDPS